MSRQMGNRKEHRWRATLAFLLAMLLSTTLYATPAHAQSGPSSSTPDDAVREDVGFYVRAQIPENQIDKRLSYFDLRMAPEQRQSLFVEVVNTSGCDIQVCVEANTARTSRHGIIEYTNSTAYDETLRVPFSDIP